MHGVLPHEEITGWSWRLFLDASSGFGARVACLQDEIVGLAVHSWHLNSWTSGIDGCLDTLFVSPEARGAGVGQALIEDLLIIARRRRWNSVFWHVQADNVTARNLYRRYASDDGYLRYRVQLIPSSASESD